MITPLERQLVDQLIRKYESQGIHVQKVLDNPLFQQLPLQSKIQAINEYASKLSGKPSYNIKNVGASSLMGAGGMSMLVASKDLLEYGRVNPANAIASGIFGAALGLASGAYMEYKDTKRSSETAKLIAEGTSLKSLVDRSLMKPIEDVRKKVSGKMVVDLIENNLIGKIRSS